MRLLAAACAAFVLMVSAAQATVWIAYAVNDSGFGGATAYSEEDARQEAISRCESRTGSSCYESTSVPRDNWHLVAISCPEGWSVGASKESWEAAKRVAANKIGANPNRCDVRAED